MRTTIFLILTTMLLAFPLHAQTEVSGAVYGEWTAEDSPYIVTDSTWVPEDSTLTISEGVSVSFNSTQSLHVFGSLLIEGTEEDSVFISSDTEDHEGFILIYLHRVNESHSIEYCSLVTEGNAILLAEYADILIENSTILATESLIRGIRDFQNYGWDIEINFCNFEYDAGIQLHSGTLYATNSRFGIEGEGGIHITFYSDLYLENCNINGYVGAGSDDRTRYKNCKILAASGQLGTADIAGVDGYMIDCLVEGNLKGYTIQNQEALIKNTVVRHTFRGRLSGTIDSCTIGTPFTRYASRIEGGGGPYITVKNTEFFHQVSFLPHRYPENSDFTFEECTFHDNIRVRDSDADLVFEKCIFYKRFIGGFSYWQNVSIRNNSFLITDGDDSILNFHFPQEMEYYEIINNIFYTTDDRVTAFDIRDTFENYPEYIIQYNCFYGFREFNSDRGIELDLDSTNIFEDPLFVYEREYGDIRTNYLSWESPCIDAGDPDSPLDPDSSRADIGAFWFDREVSANQRSSLLPSEYSLSAYPNPFNSSTTISYSLPTPGMVSLTIFDMQGRELQRITDRYHSAGNHEITLTSANLASGAYYVQVAAQGAKQSLPLLLLK